MAQKQPQMRCINYQCPQQKDRADGICDLWADCPVYRGGRIESVPKQKYHAEKVMAGGEKFDSKKERRRWDELVLMQRAGKIRNLRRQVAFELIPTQRPAGEKAMRACKYIADFVYEDERGKTCVEDVKGYKGGAAYAVFVIKKKLMYQRHGILVKEI